MAPTQQPRAAAPYFSYASGDGKGWRSWRGDFTAFFYIVVWLSSLGAPFILCYLWVAGHTRAFAAALGAALLAYAPGVPRVPALKRFLSVARYYRSASLRWCAAPATAAAVARGDAAPTVLCVHPHGIFCQAWAALFLTEEAADVTFCFSNALVMSPYFRLLCRLTGFPSKCDRDSMKRLMRERKRLALIPGGFHEATVHSPTEDRLFLKTRKGFVKYALEFGYSLTPVYGFGEKDTFANLQGFWKLRLWLNDLGLPAIVPFGRWFCPLLPRNERLHVVVGEPLAPPARFAGGGTKPSKADVDAHHAAYCACVQALYARFARECYAVKEGDPTPELKLW